MRLAQTLLITSHFVLVGHLSMSGCGLDGIKGELVRIHGNQYILREPGGKELTIHIDTHTHKDVVQPGDEVQVYITKEGHAEFIQRLEK